MEKQKLPNATTSLVLGIISIVTCICYGVIGLPLGIIAVVLGQKSINLYKKNPEDYTNLGNATAGKITGIVGIILNILYLSFIVWIVYKIGLDAFKDPALMQERVNEILGK